jgi:regulator of protease activity HflC (stomatin/prohibitin superfamily)
MEFDRLVVSFLADEVVGGFFISVPPGHIACVYDRGRGVLPRVWGPGLHLKIPFWQIAKLFNAQMLEYTIRTGFDLSVNPEALGDEPINTTTADANLISVQGSVLFRIDKNNAPELWENIGEHFVSKLVRPLARSRISAAFSTIKFADVTASRSDLEKKLKEELNAEFQDKGLLCEGVLLSEVKSQKDHGGGKSIFGAFKAHKEE